MRLHFGAEGEKYNGKLYIEIQHFFASLFIRPRHGFYRQVGPTRSRGRGRRTSTMVRGSWRQRVRKASNPALPSGVCAAFGGLVGGDRVGGRQGATETRRTEGGRGFPGNPLIEPKKRGSGVQKLPMQLFLRFMSTPIIEYLLRMGGKVKQ